jgi:radical SAM protein with 4Fe4S-binding SPASM domain
MKIMTSHNPGDNEVTGNVFLPRVISWNMTLRCNLQCPHCYIDAGGNAGKKELTTAQGKLLIDQIAEVSRPLLIFSGGEPLLRPDICELARYATEKGLTVAMGTNGTLINDTVARKLKSAGVKAVAVSIDSHVPELHDTFRGQTGAWEQALQGIDACIRSGIRAQVNTTVTPQNFDEIDRIIDLAGEHGASSFHLFFLVPAGRGANIGDISPDMYEDLISRVLDTVIQDRLPLRIRPVCAPQFIRIASTKGYDLKEWGRGCIAGLSYCRIYPTGEVTPCPYLPVTLGNILDTDFKDIWFNSPVLKKLRDVNTLKGKCGACEYRNACGGCRARAYGMTGPVNTCSGLHEPGEPGGDYMAEEPWCPYIPGSEDT